MLLDPPAVLEIMECIFGTPDFVNTSGAGDFPTIPHISPQFLKLQ